MRRRALLCLLAALPATLVIAVPAQALPDLVVSSAAEPPDFEVPGGRFRHSFTVSNNGSDPARTSAIGAFLSPDPVRGDNDIALRGTRRTSSLISTIRARRQRTRRVTLNIADSVASGFYFLIECADGGNRVRESNERNNCRISGQRVGINASERGQPGAAGPAGPAGPAGRDVDRRRIARTQVELGTKTFDSPSGPGDDEGSTTLTELARVGNVIVRGMCRQTTNGDNADPGTPFGAVGGFDEDGDEGKILIYTDTGTVSFQGLHGPRVGIEAGEGTPRDEDAGGGEGAHMFVGTKRDPDPNTTSGGAARAWQFGFRSVTGWVSHSNGMELIISAYAGIDVLGVGDKCVFGGVVTVVNPGT